MKQTSRKMKKNNMVAVKLQSRYWIRGGGGGGGEKKKKERKLDFKVIAG